MRHVHNRRRFENVIPQIDADELRIVDRRCGLAAGNAIEGAPAAQKESQKNRGASPYNHQRSKDANEMEQLERKILRRLAIPDPYRSPAKSFAKSLAKSPAKTAKKRRDTPLNTMRSR